MSGEWRKRWASAVCWSRQGTARAVAMACVRLLAHAAERKALGAAARARVLQHFTTDHCFGTYRSLYDQLRTRQPEVIELTEEEGVSRWPAFVAEGGLGNDAHHRGVLA